jgi:hypothetical protein
MILDPVPNTIRSRIPNDSLLAFVSLTKQSSSTTYSVITARREAERRNRAFSGRA